MVRFELKPIRRSIIVRDLKHLGLVEGDTIMLHSSVKAVGWIVGGPDVLIQAILDVVGEDGTLMMYVSWEDSPYHLESWPTDRQDAYLAECPAFDPIRSRACRDWSILTEYLRTWPSAYRSGNPEASCAAVGAKARWLTEEHPLHYGYGFGSPFEKLCIAKGKVLLLGAPFSSLTILHYAEHLANIPSKLVVHYKVPLLQNREKRWVEIEEFDTCGNVLRGTSEYFELIPREFLSKGGGNYAKVGEAHSYLFDALEFVTFAIRWLEEHSTA